MSADFLGIEIRFFGGVMTPPMRDRSQAVGDACFSSEQSDGFGRIAWSRVRVSPDVLDASSPSSFSI
jgi:hypothetical protein